MKKLMTIDFSFFITFGLAFFSGNVDVYLTYLIAILIHECGHLMVASLFKWEVESFKITALGGFLSFKNELSRPPLQSITVALGGIIFNLIFLNILKQNNGPSSLIYTQYAIIIFNLLPVTPLDGSKVLHATLRLIMNYKSTLSVLKFTNFLFLFLFTGAVFAFRLDSYIVVAVLLGIFVGKFSNNIGYLNQRYLIQKQLK